MLTLNRLTLHTQYFNMFLPVLFPCHNFINRVTKIPIYLLPPGITVATLTCSDDDGTSPNNALTYAITNGDDGGQFDMSGGTVQTTAQTLDADTKHLYTLFVTVTDGADPFRSTTVTVSVTVSVHNHLHQALVT